MKNTKIYCPPQVWCGEVRTEQGFAGSGFNNTEGTEDVTTSGDYIVLYFNLLKQYDYENA